LMSINLSFPLLGIARIYAILRWFKETNAIYLNFPAFWRGEFKNSLFRFIYFKTGS
jgi:hypothetical protein